MKTLNNDPWLLHIMHCIGLDDGVPYHDVEFALCEYRKLSVGDGLPVYAGNKRSWQLVI
jgi:hypothetical protein